MALACRCHQEMDHFADQISTVMMVTVRPCVPSGGRLVLHARHIRAATSSRTVRLWNLQRNRVLVRNETSVGWRQEIRLTIHATVGINVIRNYRCGTN